MATVVVALHSNLKSQVAFTYPLNRVSLGGVLVEAGGETSRAVFRIRTLFESGDL